VLNIMHEHWPTTFNAADVAQFANEQGHPHAANLRDFLYPGHPQGHIATPKSVGKRLKSHIGEPVRLGDKTLILRALPSRTGTLAYFVHVG
jgi:hypothetical protein